MRFKCMGILLLQRTRFIFQSENLWLYFVLPQSSQSIFPPLYVLAL